MGTISKKSFGAGLGDGGPGNSNSSYYISAKTISLSEGTDPGSLSKTVIQKIKEKLYGSSDN